MLHALNTLAAMVLPSPSPESGLSKAFSSGIILLAGTVIVILGGLALVIVGLIRRSNDNELSDDDFND